VLTIAELPVRDQPQFRRVPVSCIRRDGDTQRRMTEDAELVAEYCALMRGGYCLKSTSGRSKPPSAWGGIKVI